MGMNSPSNTTGRQHAFLAPVELLLARYPQRTPVLPGHELSTLHTQSEACPRTSRLIGVGDPRPLCVPSRPTHTTQVRITCLPAVGASPPWDIFNSGSWADGGSWAQGPFLINRLPAWPRLLPVVVVVQQLSGCPVISDAGLRRTEGRDRVGEGREVRRGVVGGAGSRGKNRGK